MWIVFSDTKAHPDMLISKPIETIAALHLLDESLPELISQVEVPLWMKTALRMNS